MARAMALFEADEGFVESFLHGHPDYTPIACNDTLILVPYDIRLERGQQDDDFVVPDAFGPRLGKLMFNTW